MLCIFFAVNTGLGQQGKSYDAHVEQSEECVDNKVTLASRDELISIAAKEFERRGGNFDDKWNVRIDKDGCDFWVVVTEIPERPGGAFGVKISGTTKKVLYYIGGA